MTPRPEQVLEWVADSPERQVNIDAAEQARSVLPAPGTVARIGEVEASTIVGPYASTQTAASTWNVTPTDRGLAVHGVGLVHDGARWPERGGLFQLSPDDWIISLVLNAQIKPLCVAIEHDAEARLDVAELAAALPAVGFAVYTPDEEPIGHVVRGAD
jgi:hypothetical protein